MAPQADRFARISQRPHLCPTCRRARDFFLAEWLSNPISVRLGPRTFGLPYRFGHLRYAHAHDNGEILGTVTANEGRLGYRAAISATSFDSSDTGSPTEFLLERYTAFTCLHPAPPAFPSVARALAADANRNRSHCGRFALLYRTVVEKRRIPRRKLFPGVDVWMGRPHRIRA